MIEEYKKEKEVLECKLLDEKESHTQEIAQMAK